MTSWERTDRGGVHLAALAALLCALQVVACGEQNNEPAPGNQIGTNEPNPTDAGTTDSGADAPLADATDHDTEPQAGCDGAHEDLGTLSVGSPTVVSRTLKSTQGAPTSCAPNGDNRGEYVFTFRAEELAIAEVLVSASTTAPISFGLYENSCEADAELFCSQQSPWRAIVEPQHTYYLKVQAGQDTPDKAFNISIGLEPAACIPGETTCSDGASEACVQGTSVETYSCAGDCSSGDACNGDTCETALVVEPTPSGQTVVVQGDRRAYTHRWNAADFTGCEASETLENGDTTAMEVFARVPSLLAGQTLTVADASGAGSYLYYVLDDCAATSCREAMFIDDGGENRLVWDVPADGDYIVVIEALSSTSRPFQFEFMLQ
ncbi:hypothetical protein FIV42_13515 [Persicimonas caeni]|uniref:Peptidase C-terminal archaeal/bacterial domain-containing protein n=1 Tax=Persicimonas caeni TaxID=2292766 RepID=A0A4Y6PTV2_PERCE|nr:hypothetical protein [Persicimonas caeni]QDG51728.1 hypothetical protein FIV42_13515 [Persicimonas caeni]QED32949.1 hypothetical protein FRD00_13510 [Persicimonas caeni]